ncbi:phage tail tape measure protein [Bradyrhizobium sp. Arg237L]|uniref:phage tail tape measure protein n=1 Tax=Bradyrhizobium sp. Arg237L TaxID=3003352 RepID=UPI00249F2B9D|nr:phage tail tape measure protein [Bradyrhizobium sp. Arg237L]MDI4236797.1 phage tail tape measure protein [Bradyrhizobium sp. Arg237L]
MSNPSVTAVISATDLASPKVRELMATLKQAQKLAGEAFDGGVGGKYAAGLNQATLAAKGHLGVLHQIHSAHKAIAATVAGYAASRVVHGGIEAIKESLPYLREDRAIQARTGYSDKDMVALRKQQNELAKTYGANVEATQKAQETFGRLKYDAATNVAITTPTAVGARAMGVTPEQNAELMESMISQYGVHFDNPADAQRKATHLNDLAAAATKKSNMTFEDVLEYTKYSAAAANAVNISPEQNLAMGMALRRAGIVGSEGGVFARQLYAREMAPTRKGREILAQNGINIDEYATHGTVSGEGLSDKFARQFGKSLSSGAIAALNKELEENGGEILADRGKFAKAVVKARTGDGEKLSETDRKHLVQAANEYFDFTKSGFRGGALMDAVIATGNPMLMQGFLGDKQGARGVALMQNAEHYNEAKGDLAHADGFAQNVANKMNEGLAAATERLTASFEALRNTMVQANDGWLTPLANGATAVASAFTNLSPEVQKAAGIFAGVATVAAGGGMAVAFGKFLLNVNSLAASAGQAAVALEALALAGGVPGVPGGKAGKPGVLGSSGKGMVFKTGAAALGATLGPVAAIAAWQVAEIAWPHVEEWATRDDVTPGSEADLERRRRFAMGPATWGRDTVPYNRRKRVTLDADTSNNLGGAEIGKSGGWQDSTVLGDTKPSKGFGDPGKTSTQVDVQGTVSGQAELHANIAVDVRPTAYLESVVKRAESVANMALNGRLGTSMQGPGDNGTKPSMAGAVSSGGHASAGAN